MSILEEMVPVVLKAHRTPADESKFASLLKTFTGKPFDEISAQCKSTRTRGCYREWMRPAMVNAAQCYMIKIQKRDKFVAASLQTK